jgi:hypothetical protein
MRHRADDRGSDGFVTGFVLGGAIFGALGFLLAPQVGLHMHARP